MRRPRTNLVAELTDTLRREILENRLSPGDRLPTESALGASAGVSRTVVREAVASLKAEGLVETRQGAGAFVLELPPRAGQPRIEHATAEDILSVLELRLAIEVEAAALAAERRTEADLAALRQALADFDTARRAGNDGLEADANFHRALAAATQNPRFHQYLEELGEFAFPRRHLPEAVRDTMVLKDDLTLVAREHETIYEAVAAGDGATAARTMRLHLGGSRARYTARMRARAPAEPETAKRRGRGA